MTDNVIKFTKRQYDSCLKNLKIVEKVLNEALYNEDFVILRKNFRPIYTNERTALVFDHADAYVSGVCTGALRALNEIGPVGLFERSDLPELLEINVKDIENQFATVITIPFNVNIVSISLMPMGKAWVLVDAFINSDSCFQEGIDKGCEALEITRDDLF